ncbi:MAG: hypothetical protein HOP03_15895 [Lysobacter sp.]|nr:hypothetical protein [Lysobacter sp.]
MSGPPAGSLDTAFSNDGIVAHHNAAGGNGSDNGEAVAIDSNGRIVVAGYSTNANNALVMTLWRYTSTGALDTTFNGTGHATHAGGGGANANDQAIASSVAIDASGRILVGGYSIAANVWGMAMWRFNANGTPDDTFGAAGSDGMVRFPSPQSGGTVATMAPNGHIRASGFTWNGTDWDSALWRYDANGAFDAGRAYIYSNYSTGGNNEDIAVDVAHDTNGRVVMTGYRTNAAGNQDMTVFRFSDDDGGPLDDNFGTGGIVSHDNAAGGQGNDVGRAIAFDSDGKIVIAGWSPRGSGDTNGDMAIWRFNGNGTLDATFKSSGYVTHHAAAGGDGNDWGRAVVIDGKGRIVVAGQSANTAGDADMAVWRYLANGELDTAFGGKGWIVNAAGAGGTSGSDGARGIAIDANGRLVVVGRSANANGDIDMTIWRILP